MRLDCKLSYRYQVGLLENAITAINDGRYGAGDNSDLCNRIQAAVDESKRFVVANDFEAAYDFLMDSVAPIFQEANRRSNPKGEFTKLWRQLILEFDDLDVMYNKLYIVCVPTLNNESQNQKWEDMKFCINLVLDDFGIHEIYVDPTPFFGVRILTHLHDSIDQARTFVTSITPSEGLSSWLDSEKTLYRSMIERGVWNECSLTDMPNSYLDNHASSIALFVNELDELKTCGIDLKDYTEAFVFVWNDKCKDFTCHIYMHGIFKDKDRRDLF